MPDLPSLVIEYKIPRGVAAGVALKKRHALEELLDATLRKRKLGDCDGGSIGAGTMEVFCYVKNYAKARALIVKAIKGTSFADFTRIYKIAPEKPAPASKAALFRKGDCLALRDGRRWGAAYVLAVEPNGTHVVVTLDYLDASKPELAAFRRMKPLVLTHHEWESAIDVAVLERPSKAAHTRMELVGNAPRKFANIELGRYRGNWVNWKQRRDRITRAFARNRSLGVDKAAGKYVSFGDAEWLLTLQVKWQRAWDARRPRR